MYIMHVPIPLNKKSILLKKNQLNFANKLLSNAVGKLLTANLAGLGGC
jgi:hypothetical protein